MKTAGKLLKKMTANEMIRYLFFGGCTTALNLAVFSILRYGAGWSGRTANLCSIVAAVLFAFFGNKWFVFRADGKGILEEFAEFAGMRMLTMAVEFFGVDLLVNQGGLPELAGKLLIQLVVIVSNYLISKFVVFREKRQQETAWGGVADE